MAVPRVAFIGTGNIANMHAPAFREAGFDITAVCARPGSDRARSFAQKHGVPHVFEDAAHLLAARDMWDALLIAVATDSTLEILEAATPSKAPILVEKPVALRSEELARNRSGYPQVLVAYNRRFYPQAQRLKQEAEAGGPAIAHMMLPDALKIPDRPQDDPTYLRRFFENSVHGLDLLRFVFGELQIEHVSRVHTPGGALAGFAATLRACERGTVIQLTANWRAPANFGMTLYRLDRRIEMVPFEAGAVYKGMQVIDPTPEMPIRQYVPKLHERIAIPAEDLQFKPGFVEQSRSLRSLLEGRGPGPAATLEDAYQAIRLAEELVG